ncbi:glycosyltransferase [Microbacterium sp. NPDC090007]|uniref:glycosyltransferase n=1 Tax=Microbacterium sp. NPDC090007 TaxID=3364204 RepID=UPI00380C976C
MDETLDFPLRANRPRVSVCMAAYNGARFIEEQIASILSQLVMGDELIVIDDGSRDDTVDRVRRFADNRIRLVINESNVGYVRTFEKAIGLASNEVLFLSDQDDRWIPARVESMVAALNDVDLVVSNFASFGGELTRVQRMRLKASDSGRWFSNIFWMWVGTRPYYGCCMAFRKELVDDLLPFPEYLSETHDQWIGYVANARHSVRHLEVNTVDRRVHDANSSARGNRPVLVVLRARIMTGRAILEALRRARRHQRRGR